MFVAPLRSFARSLAYRSRARRRICDRRRFSPALPAAAERLENRDLLSTVSGIVYEDLNGNGIRESDRNGDGTADGPEPGIAGVRVFLDQNENGVPDAGETAVTTGADGRYQFDGLAAGTYTVAQVVENGWMQTSPGPATGPDLWGHVTGDFAFDLPDVLLEQPMGMAWAGDAAAGSLYVIDRGADSDAQTAVYQLDAQGLTPGAVVSKFTAPEDIWDITYDGQYFWGASRSGAILQFDLQADADGDGVADIVGGPVSVGADLRGIAWDGASLWVLDVSAGVISEIDPSDGSVLRSIAAPGSDLFGLAWDGEHLWTNGYQSHLTYEIDPTTGVVLRTIATPVRETPVALGAAFDGEGLWISQHHDQHLVRLNIDSPGTHSTTVDGTAIISGLEFGVFQLGAVTGHVFEDLNGNGLQDAGEPDVGDRRVFHDGNGNGFFEEWELSTTTDGSGVFTLSGLPVGDAPIAVDLQHLGWAATNGQLRSAMISASSGIVAIDAFGVRLEDVGPVGGNARLSETISGDQTFSGWLGAKVAFDADGNSAAVWNGNGPGDADGVFMRMFDATGHALTGDILVNSTTSGVQNDPAIAMADDGRFAVAWGSGDRSYVRLFSADGSPRTGEITVRKGGKGSTLVHGIAMDADGDFAVLYGVYTSSSPTFYVQRFDAAGAAQGSAIFVYDTNGVGALGAIGMSDTGEFAVVWEQDRNIHVQRYDAAGQAAGGTIVISGPEFRREKPSLAMNSHGEFVVTWWGGGRWAQLFNADGSAAGPRFLYSERDTPSGPGSVGIDDSGRMILAYTDQAFSDSDVFLAVFDRAGNQLTEAFQVNADPLNVDTAHQDMPSVAASGRGDFAVLWRSRWTDADGSDAVYLQRFPGPPLPPSPGITVTPTSGLETTEAGGTATFDVVLDAQPTADVTIAISSSDATEGTVDKSSLTFTSSNWNVPQTVTVTGLDDPDVDGAIAYTIVTAAAVSSDPGYSGLDPADVSVTNVDNDAPPASPSDMYVWDLVPEVRTRGKGGSATDARISVEIRRDSDADGIAASADEAVAGATVTVEIVTASGVFAIVSGTTDSSGVFISDWIKDLPDGAYAEVVGLTHPSHTWEGSGAELDPTANDADADADGNPDEQLTASATLSSSSLSLASTETSSTELMTAESTDWSSSTDTSLQSHTNHELARIIELLLAGRSEALSADDAPMSLAEQPQAGASGLRWDPESQGELDQIFSDLDSGLMQQLAAV